MTPTLGRMVFAAALLPALALGATRSLPPAGAGPAAGATIAELTARVSALEQRNAVLERELAALVRSTARLDASRVKAPFEVVDRAGRPILRVVEGEPTGAGVVITSGAGGARHGVYVLNAKGARVAALGQAPAGRGALAIREPDGKVIFAVTDGAPTGTGVVVTGGDHGARRGLYVLSDGGTRVAGIAQAPDGYGVLALRDAKGITRARADGTGTLRISNAKGSDVLRVAEEPGSDPAQVIIAGGADGGSVRVANGRGKAVAGLLGGVRGAGAVAVGNGEGQTLAEMSVSPDGRGLFQVLGQGGQPIAVLTQAIETHGGLLQISNKTGPVMSLTVGSGGGGYWQLNDASGRPTVEAGTLPSGAGVVRAGPTYKCSPVQAATPVLAVGLPDCIVGSQR